MTVQFGSPVGTVKELKEKVSAGGGPSMITFVPDESKGTLTVRFLTEPEEWIGYREVYDPIKRRYWPVPPDDSMPGTPDPDVRVSKRFLANAVDRATDRVIAIKLPASLVEQLIIRYDRFSTILDRDYILGRSGSGLDTDYYCDPEPPTKAKTDKYNPMDLNQVLVGSYESVWGPVQNSNTSAPATTAAGHLPRKPRTRISDPVVEEEESPVQDLDELAQQADDEDDATAAATLTSLADDMGINPETYESWVEVVEAIKAGPQAQAEPEDDDTETGDDEAEDDEEQSYASMGAVVDDDDADEEVAQPLLEVLELAADHHGIDPEEFDTWEDVGEKLDELSAAGGNGSEAETEAVSEEAEEEADSDSEAETWTEDELKGKQIGELRALARDQGINTSGLNKSALVDALL
jgi:hypothetical protein